MDIDKTFSTAIGTSAIEISLLKSPLSIRTASEFLKISSMFTNDFAVSTFDISFVPSGINFLMFTISSEDETNEQKKFLQPLLKE